CPSHPAMVERIHNTKSESTPRARGQAFFGKMNPMITGYAIAERFERIIHYTISKRIRSLPASSLLPRFGRGPAPAGRRKRLPHLTYPHLMKCQHGIHFPKMYKLQSQALAWLKPALQATSSLPPNARRSAPET